MNNHKFEFIAYIQSTKAPIAFVYDESVPFNAPVKSYFMKHIVSCGIKMVEIFKLNKRFSAWTASHIDVSVIWWNVFQYHHFFWKLHIFLKIEENISGIEHSTLAYTQVLRSIFGNFQCDYNNNVLLCNCWNIDQRVSVELLNCYDAICYFVSPNIFFKWNVDSQ